MVDWMPGFGSTGFPMAGGGIGPLAAEVYALKATRIYAAGLASGGGTLNGDRTITVEAASEASAITGSGAGAMTPATTAAVIAHRFVTLTQSAYNALGAVDPTVFYFIVEG